jgi:hypothetical protein
MHNFKKLALVLTLGSSMAALAGCTDDLIVYSETAYVPPPLQVTPLAPASGSHYGTPPSPAYSGHSGAYYGPPAPPPSAYNSSDSDDGPRYNGPAVAPRPRPSSGSSYGPPAPTQPELTESYDSSPAQASLLPNPE